MPKENEQRRLKALILTRDREAISLLEDMLRRKNYKIIPLRMIGETEEEAHVDVIISDADLRDPDAMEKLKDFKRRHPNSSIIYICGTREKRRLGLNKRDLAFFDNVVNHPIDTIKLINSISKSDSAASRKYGGTKDLEMIAKRLYEQNLKLRQRCINAESSNKVLREREKELKKANRTLEKLSVLDSLTSLYNHRCFQQRLTEEFKRALRYQHNLSLVMMDIDDFKNVNDTYGHQIGDLVLKEVSSIILKSIRSIDIPARYGGEEFAILLPYTPLRGAAALAERIRTNIQNHRFVLDDGHSFHITASFGVSSLWTGSYENEGQLLRAADKALYKAKNIGKNRVVIGTFESEEAIGGGERFTPAEKEKLLTRLSHMLASRLDIKSIYEILTRELMAAFCPPTSEQCGIFATLVNPDTGKISPLVEINTADERRYYMEIARRVSRTKKPAYIKRRKGRAPVACAPCQVRLPEQDEKIVVGTVAINRLPVDRDFFENFCHIAAPFIYNALLNEKLASARKETESELGELALVNFLRKGMEINRKLRSEVARENMKLLGRLISQMGFDPLYLFLTDDHKNTFRIGIDGASGRDFKYPLPTEDDVERFGMLFSILRENPGKKLMVLDMEVNFTDEEKKYLKGWNLEKRKILLGLVNSNAPFKSLIIGAKDEITDRELQSVRRLILQAEAAMR